MIGDHTNSVSHPASNLDDALAAMYDALGFAVRELGKAHDVLSAVAAGIELEQLPGAILDATRRVERVYAVAAELRGRYA